MLTVGSDDVISSCVDIIDTETNPSGWIEYTDGKSCDWSFSKKEGEDLFLIMRKTVVSSSDVLTVYNGIPKEPSTKEIKRYSYPYGLYSHNLCHNTIQCLFLFFFMFI